MTDRLHEMNPMGRFHDRAETYARHRPGYPDEAIDALLEAAPGASGAPVIADIGAGTGILSKQLADRGAHVEAIEPNAPMRTMATPHPHIRWHDATGEATGLAEASVDAVTCAQAFHWLDASQALGEFRRILRPDGIVALVWNDRDTSDEFAKAYDDALRRAADSIEVFERAGTEQPLVDSPMFETRPLQGFRYEQRHDLDGLIGRAVSSSYIPSSGSVHDRLIEELHEMHARYADANGSVTLVYRTTVCIGVRR